MYPFDIFYPGPVHAERHIMLGFAGYRTGVAANALAIVDNKSKIHVLSSLSSTDPPSDAGFEGQSQNVYCQNVFCIDASI